MIATKARLQYGQEFGHSLDKVNSQLPVEADNIKNEYILWLEEQFEELLKAKHELHMIEINKYL